MAEAIRQRSWSGAVLVALLAAAALGVGWSGLRDRSAGSQESAVALRYAGTVRAPEFPEDIPWLNTDRPLSLAELRGRFVLLDFWTYCCINCMHILPELKQLEHAWPDALVVIGVHSAKFSGEQETDNIRQAIARYQIEHPVVNDAQFRVWTAYAVNAWPTLVLIDPEGRIVGTNSGEITFEQFNPIIAEAVAEAERAGTLKRSRPTWQRAPGATAGGVLAYPGKVLADGPGGRLFIADSTHHRVLVAGLDGRVTTIIGSGRPGLTDGPVAAAAFRNPQGLALVGDALYVADTENHALRAVDLKAGTVRTLVGTGRKPSRLNLSGRGTDVSLHSPWDVLFHDGLLYVANAGSHQLWTVDPATAEARPYAGSGREDLGDGPRYIVAMGAAGVDLARTAKLAQPSGLSTDGRRLYFADSETSSLRSVGFGDQATVTTHLGQGLFEFGDVDGARDQARLQHPLGVACVDGVVYLADTYNNKLKRYDPATGRVTTFAGTGAPGHQDGPAAQATFDEPGGLSQAGGKLYVADTGNGAIRVVDLKTGEVRLEKSQILAPGR